MYFHASWSLWTTYDSHKLSMAKINLVKKTILLSPTLHAIRGTTSGYIWDPSEDGNSQQVTLPPIAQYAFDHGGDIPPN